MAYEISSGDMKSESGEIHGIDCVKHVVTSAAEPRAGDRAADRTRPRPDAATPPHTTRDTRRHRAAHTLHINHTHADTHSHTSTGQTPCPPCAPTPPRAQPTRLKPPLRSCSRASLLLLDPNAHRQLLRALDSEIRFASAKHPPGRSFLVSCPRVSELQRVLRVRVREVSR